MELDFDPMAVPKFDYMFNPLLRALRAFGGSASTAELEDKVAEYLDLSEEDIRRSHGGKGRKRSETRFGYNLGWSRSYLKKYGLIDNPYRGEWVLTEKGKRIHQVDPEEVKRNFKNKPKPKKLKAKNWEGEALELINAMSNEGFEKFCKQLLQKEGFVEIEVTSKSDNGRIDGKGIVRQGCILSFHVHFQCNRNEECVSEGVRDFRGAMLGRADKGIIMTTGTFTQEAKKEALRDGASPLDLVNGIELVNMLKKYELGISVKERMVMDVEVNEKWFEVF